ELSASFAGLVQLDPIAALTSLRSLDVSYNKIGCVGVLATAKSIEHLNISHNCVASLNDVLTLNSLDRLSSIEVWGNPFCKVRAVCRKSKSIFLSKHVFCADNCSTRALVVRRDDLCGQRC